MAIWMCYVLLGVAGLTSYNVVTKISGGKFEPLLTMSIATLFSTALLGVITMIYYYKKDLAFSTALSSNGIITAIIIGVTFTAINLGYIFTFAKGGPVSAVGPTISGTSMVLVIIISTAFFGEGLTMNKIIGAVSLSIGMIFLIKG